MIRALKIIMSLLMLCALVFGLTATHTGLKIVTKALEHTHADTLHFKQVEGTWIHGFYVARVDISVGQYDWSLRQVRAIPTDHHFWRYHVTIDHIVLRKQHRPHLKHMIGRLRYIAWSLNFIDYLQIKTLNVPHMPKPLTDLIIDQRHPNIREFEMHCFPFVHLKAHAAYAHHSWHGDGIFMHPPLMAQPFHFDTHHHMHHRTLILRTSGPLGHAVWTASLNANQLNTQVKMDHMMAVLVKHNVPLEVDALIANILISTHQQSFDLSTFDVRLNHHPIRGQLSMTFDAQGLKKFHAHLAAKQGNDHINLHLTDQQSIHQDIAIAKLSKWLPHLRGNIRSNMHFRAGQGLYGFTEIKNFFSKHLQAKSIVLRQNGPTSMLALELRHVKDHRFSLNNTAIEMAQNTSLTPRQIGHMVAQSLQLNPTLQKSFKWLGRLYPQWAKKDDTSQRCDANACTQKSLTKDRWRHFSLTSKTIPLKALRKWLPEHINLDMLNGNCAANIAVAINIDKPWQLRGEITLAHIQFDHYPSNTHWEKGEMRIMLTPSRIEAKGNILLNGHPLQVDLKTKTALHAPLIIHVKGKHIPLTIYPTLKVVLSPTLQLKQHDAIWDISGKTNIDRGFIGAAYSNSQVTLPINTTIVGRPKQQDLGNYLIRYLRGGIDVSTSDHIVVQNFFGFIGNLSGQMYIRFQPQKQPTAHGAFVLKHPQYVNHPNIQIERAHIAYRDNQLNNPILNFKLSRNISSIIFDFNHPTQIFDGKKVGLTITGSAMWPQYRLFSDDSNLSQLQMVSALLSGSPHGFSPDQDMIYALNLINNRPNTERQPLLSPLQKIKHKLGLDQLYLSTPLVDDNLIENTFGNTEITMTKNLMANLMATYRSSILNDDYLLALNYLIRNAVKLQLYAKRKSDELFSLHSYGLNLIQMKKIQ